MGYQNTKEEADMNICSNHILCKHLFRGYFELYLRWGYRYLYIHNYRNSSHYSETERYNSKKNTLANETLALPWFSFAHAIGILKGIFRFCIINVRASQTCTTFFSQLHSLVIDKLC